VNDAAERVSVVVPSYNHEPFVGAAIRSILRQTRLPDELVVIDDGSRDGSVSVIERELANAPIPARLIARPNRGLSATLNEGLALTSGAYFAYLASDDLWAPGRLAAGLAALEARPEAVMAFGAATIIDEHDRVLSTWGRNYHVADLSVDDLLRFRSIPLAATVTFRRVAIEGIGWNEDSAMEDYELYLRLAARGPFAYVDKPEASWRMHETNVSKDLPRMLHEALATQGRVAVDLGIDADALAMYRQRVRFAYGGFFLQAHRWEPGARLTFANLRGAPSWKALLRRLVHVMTPPRLLKARQAIRERRVARGDDQDALRGPTSPDRPPDELPPPA
jgi:glycosyltransferase involved in cell wall biosynthesis